MKKKEYSKARKSFDLLETKLKAMYQNPDIFKDWLKKQLNFNQYSTNNRNLIFFQNPEAKYVATYNKWKELGFPVVKSGGIKILCPVLVEVFVDKDGKIKPVKKANANEKQQINDKLIETKKILYDYVEKTVFDIECTNATEKDLVNLNIMKNQNNFGVDVNDLSDKLCNYFNETPDNNPYENIYNIVKNNVKDITETDGGFDENTSRIVTEAVTFSVLNQMHIDTSLFEFNTLNNLNYQNDAEVLSKISNEICNATDFMVEMLMEIV